MAKLVGRLQWPWMALAVALAVPWMLIWDSASQAGLLYVNEFLAAAALACGVFWVYRRVVDLVFFKRHDVGAAIGRVVGTSALVVIVSFTYVQAAYALKIDGSPGPRESQALWAGVFLISAFGIYRVLDVGNRPERPVNNV